MSVETVQETLQQAASGGGGYILSPLLTGVLGTILIMALYEYWHRNSREYRMVENIPSPPTLPLVGMAHLVVGLSNAEILSVGLGYLNKYGETMKAWLGNVLVVFLTNPSDIELILSGHQHLTKAEEYRYFKPWFGDGLLISNGHHWRHHRKMIAPTFHQSILKSFVPTFVDHSKAVSARMGKESGKPFDVHDYMSQTTVDILLSTAMGVKKLPEGNTSFEYAQAVVDMCDIIHKRQVKLLYRLDSIYKFTKLREKGDRMMNIILGMTRKVVKDRKDNFITESRPIIDEVEETPNPKLSRATPPAAAAKKEGLRDDLDDIDENDVGAKRRLALLDAMVEMAKNPEIEWNEKDIMDEVNTIMFEGHDTTSAGSSFALCMLGIHKDIQERVFAEQKAIFGDKMQRDCTFADTMEMKYLERVILETLRMYPPVPLIARRLDHDVKLTSGPYTVPKGTTVVVLQYCVHRRADIYPNPTKFDPDNFLPERAANRHYYSFIPFSAGPRSCVGRKYAMLKLKVLLSTIVRNYIVHSTDTEADFKLQADIILKLENGFNISLEPRKYQTVA
ncbi:cytochrome P450 4g1 [Drosophila grimshawi]|uniref:GH24346 n=1 Tax=Drosophila grimshawi TaxID=7222 RepID=B4JMD5_DROGR|nr:cytochrome P450 4g1 [Drosophila grimshawi]EDV91896.1 GH24346 [Drosophila grimshawi]